MDVWMFRRLGVWTFGRGEGRVAKEKRNPFRFEREAEVVFLWKRLGNRFSFWGDAFPNIQT